MFSINRHLLLLVIKFRNYKQNDNRNICSKWPDLHLLDFFLEMRSRACKSARARFVKVRGMKGGRFEPLLQPCSHYHFVSDFLILCTNNNKYLSIENLFVPNVQFWSWLQHKYTKNKCISPGNCKILLYFFFQCR